MNEAVWIIIVLVVGAGLVLGLYMHQARRGRPMRGMLLSMLVISLIALSGRFNPAWLSNGIFSPVYIALALLALLMMGVQLNGPRSVATLRWMVLLLLLAGNALCLLCIEHAQEPNDGWVWQGLSILAFWPLLRFVVPLGRFSAPFALAFWGLLLGGIPLIASGGMYVIIIFLGGLWLPSFRQWAPYTRPIWLPAIPKRRGLAVSDAGSRGMTLIELLIVVAIIAIFSGGMLNAVEAYHAAARRTQDRRIALAAAQDQLALLRGGEAPTTPGTYDLNAELARQAGVRGGSYRVTTTSLGAELREVTVRVEAGDSAGTLTQKLTALLPAGKREAQP